MKKATTPGTKRIHSSLPLFFVLLLPCFVNAFAPYVGRPSRWVSLRYDVAPTHVPEHVPQKRNRRCPSFLGLFAPPGSGYMSDQDEVSQLPDTYEPMMEYPGTMRPGRTPENIPYQDLPIGDNDPDPVPWPHFQEIEWHHRWDPPHEHPTPMELFIEQQGRWATPELEAEMRAGVRRGIREKKEAEEALRRGTIITDDDEDDDDDIVVDADASVALGDGIFGQLGSAADQAATAAAVDPNNQNDEKAFSEDDVDADMDSDASLDDFLLDLGLDSELGDDDEAESSSAGGSDSYGISTVTKSLRDLEGSDDEDDDTSVISSSQTIHVEEEDDDLDFEDDDDEMVGGDPSGGGPVPLDDFGDADDDENLGEDIFDEGGFDFGDDFDDGGGDMW